MTTKFVLIAVAAAGVVYVGAPIVTSMLKTSTVTKLDTDIKGIMDSVGQGKDVLAASSESKARAIENARAQFGYTAQGDTAVDLLNTYYGHNADENKANRILVDMVYATPGWAPFITADDIEVLTRDGTNMEKTEALVALANAAKARREKALAAVVPDVDAAAAARMLRMKNTVDAYNEQRSTQHDEWLAAHPTAWAPVEPMLQRASDAMTMPERILVSM
jgi:hypothetical protein